MTEYNRAQIDNNGAIWQLIALFTVAVSCTREIIAPEIRTITGIMFSRIVTFVSFCLHETPFISYIVSRGEIE